MSKSEWGEKRECPECGARFYDLKRSPAVCPKCETSFVATVERTPPPAMAPPTEKVAPVAAIPDEGDGTATKDDDPDGLGDIVIDVADDGDEEDDDIIKDDVNLGEDDDMSDVLDGAIDETKTKTAE